MKTYNQFLETPFSEEVKPEPPELPKEDPSVKSKEKRQMQIKKQVLLKKMQAVRAGAGADIVASHTPEGEELSELSKRTLGNYVKDASSDAAMKSMDHGNKPLAKDAPKREKKILKRLSGIRKATDKLSKEEVELDERLGGKGYSRSAYKGSIHPPSRKSSGDWPDSDRGAGNKAKRRAGGKVEKKSPTYQAHVLNKESKTPEDIRAADKKWLERRGRKIAQNIKDKKPVKPRQDYGEVKEGKDKAFDYVVKQLQKKHGKDAIVTKDNPMKPPSAAQKKAYAAHKAKLAKQDTRDETEKATSGRYNDRSRSD